MERVFLGWKRPGLAAAVGYLEGRAAPAGTLDFAGLVVAVPGARAGRRLLELLVQRADQRGTALVPPQIVTVGQLPELLYANRRPFAADLVQHLAWVEALKRTGAKRLEPLALTLPADGRLAAWLEPAKLLSQLHQELAAEDLGFEDLLALDGPGGGFLDARRWQALAEIQERYLAVLDEAGVWDKQTARRVALRRGEVRASADILLVGAADLNRVQRKFLDRAADRVTVLVVAPPELADRFDEHGCVRPEAWRDAPIELDARQIEVADAPSDQADAVLRALDCFGGRYGAEEVTVGVPDAAIVPWLVEHLEQAGIPARFAGGTPVVDSGPCRLLAAAAEYLEGRRWTAFAALVRHPAVHDWLAARGLRGDWLTELDDYYARHLPHVVAGAWLGPADRSRLLRQVHRAVEELVGPIGSGTRTLGDWAEPLLGVLVSFFGARPLDRAQEPDRTILAACKQVRDVLDGHRDVPAPLAPVLAGSEVLRLVLSQLDGVELPPPVQRGAIELVGWLELPLDDAPATVVTGFNEGIVPGSLGADLFLPNALRVRLEMEHNSDRRYARDAYALSLLASSREWFRLIVGRRSPEGDPLAPSRLLFACDPDTAASRALTTFRPAAARSAGRLAGGLRPGQRSCFEIPPPQPLKEPVTSMRVTEFRDYLACPYRYYLRHRLGLKRRSDSGDELDPAAFGSLAHDVLERFGRSELAGATDADEIAARLCVLLDEAVRDGYGEAPLPAVRVQVEQLRLRLLAWAQWQARWAEQGWRIEHVEQSATDLAAPWLVDGRTMELRGRIDRIDVHHDSRQVVIFDYKTSDSPRGPDEAHRRAGRWVDLQLPLYRHLARSMCIDGPVSLGYVVLPKDTTKTGALVAAWTEEDLADADRAAQEVVRGVWAQRFWPPATPVPELMAEFSPIAMEGQFGAIGASGRRGPADAGQDPEQGDPP
jgi:RecB family exonuclease